MKKKNFILIGISIILKYVMFMVLIPLLIFSSVMYYINIVKSLILVFSTPKKIINNTDVIS